MGLITPSFIRPAADVSVYANPRLLLRIVGGCYKNAVYEDSNVDMQVSVSLAEGNCPIGPQRIVLRLMKAGVSPQG